VRRGSGVLSPATHAHPFFSFLLFWTTQHEYNTTSMGGPSGLESSAPERHTFTSMARRRFLPSVRFEPTTARTTTDSHAATELQHFSFERNTSKKNQGNDSHYGLPCAKPDMQESEVNFLIDKQIKLLNVSFDEQKIIQKKPKD
jgi:hypothetical protein